MNFSQLAADRPLDSLSAVTQVTEGLLQNNFNYLLRSCNPFYHLPGR
jgi:hypothetical protein